MRRLLLIGCLLLLAGGVAACDRATTTRLDRPAATVTATDYRLDPQRLSLPAGRVRLTLRNTGEVPHNLQVRRSEEDVLLRVATVLPGRTGSAAARLRPGTYELVSTVGRDEQLGQRGTLVIR